jgi:hypothetical protein
MSEPRRLLVLAEWAWFKHMCAHVQCWTARGEPYCACGLYQLTWQESTYDRP